MTLDDYLKETGMKQSELAKRAEVAESAICRAREGLAGRSVAISIVRATGGRVTFNDLYARHLPKAA